MPDGHFFMHIFTHRSGAYLFERATSEDWIAQHFFTGGVMPSHHLIRQYADLFRIEKEWRWSGTHYQRTALDWLANFDAHRDEIENILQRGLRQRYGIMDATLALVLPRDRRSVRICRRQRMGRQPLPDGGGLSYLLSGRRIFTSSLCTYSLPQITLPVCSGSLSPSSHSRYPRLRER